VLVGLGEFVGFGVGVGYHAPAFETVVRPTNTPIVAAVSRRDVPALTGSVPVPVLEVQALRTCCGLQRPYAACAKSAHTPLEEGPASIKHFGALRWRLTEWNT
jgi:hypothetical protein